MEPELSILFGAASSEIKNQELELNSV